MVGYAIKGKEHMSWNYRVMELEDDDGEKYYKIKEVYYNRDGSLMGYCDAVVGGNSVSELIKVLDMMKEDAHKSILRPEYFEKKENAFKD